MIFWQRPQRDPRERESAVDLSIGFGQVRWGDSRRTFQALFPTGVPCPPRRGRSPDGKRVKDPPTIVVLPGDHDWPIHELSQLTLVVPIPKPGVRCLQFDGDADLETGGSGPSAQSDLVFNSATSFVQALVGSVPVDKGVQGWPCNGGWLTLYLNHDGFTIRLGASEADTR